MLVKTISLENFRNYRTQAFSFHPAINVICGENGQGKTNLIESVALISTMKLFRTSQKKEGIAFDADYAKIHAEFHAKERDFSYDIRFSNQKSLEVFKNGVRQRRQADAAGVLKTVLFCPEDLLMVKRGAQERRRFLDIALCQLRPNYAKFLEEYHRLHEHKTRILRDSDEKPELMQLWDDFSLRMAHIGALIIRYRAYYIKRLLLSACSAYHEIAPNEVLSGGYKTVSSISDPYASAQEIEKQLIDHVYAHKQAEIRTKTCLSGPHKDDFIMLLNEKSAASFASQGQVRSIALSLKLAERELFFEEDGEYPVLLLDDVLSELDRKRQDFVLNRIQSGQVFITCCEDNIGQMLGEGTIFRIENGKIK